jgi:hypothetical protein
MTHSSAIYQSELLDTLDLQQPEVYSLSDTHPRPIPRSICRYQSHYGTEKSNFHLNDVVFPHSLFQRTAT